MPISGEHACRIKSPDLFEKNSFRRIQQGKLSIIIGRLKGKETTTTQSFRYPVNKWSETEAEEHCKKNGGEFHEAG